MSQLTAVIQNGMQLPALPADLAALLPTVGSNESLAKGLGSGFVAPPRISLAGSRFHAIVDGVKTLVTIEDKLTGQRIPVPYLEGVILNSNVGKYKAFYGQFDPATNTWQRSQYNPQDEPEAPTCYSYDGERPSEFSREKQCATCAACPHNAWGSAVTQQGNETRACSDGKLLAFVPKSTVVNMADPATPAARAYQIRIPPTGLSRNKEDRKNKPNENTSLSEFVALLSKYPTTDGRSVELSARAIFTRIFFDTSVDYPSPRFQIAGFLTKPQIEYVAARAEDEDVLAAVEDRGGTPATAPATPAARVAPPPAPAAIPAPPPAPVAAPAPAPAVPAPDFGFGVPVGAAPTPAAAPASAPAAQPPAAPATRPRGRPRAQAAPPVAPGVVQAPVAAPAAPAAPAAQVIEGAPDMDAISAMFKV